MTDGKVTAAEAMTGLVASESEAQFTRLFQDEYPQITRTAYLILGDWDQAREVAQEAFTRMYAQWKKVSKYERPGAWARRIAIRLAVGSTRRNVLFAQAVAKLETDPPPPASPDLDLRSAIRSLPRAQRAAIVLHYLFDLPVVEVAENMGCSVSTAKVHLHHARKRLGEILHEEVNDVAG
jgi:DNA-directed RNA polymerase specialized sigma24 family protein